MNKFLVAGISTTLLLLSNQVMAEKSHLTASSKANNQIAQTRIVGGEQAIKENWPWMTAYVFTSTDFVTSLSVNDVIYETSAFTSGAAGQVTSQIVACGIGDLVCTDATGKVCLIERGEVDFSLKADNCEAGGGIGAIIYNNEEIGNISGTLGDDYTGTIPVVAVNREDGLTLLEQEGSVASLSVSATAELQQDSTCGASFLGDKWVLTAAHCVDDGNPFGFKMNVGEYDLSDGAENAIDIANIFIHPLYDADVINNDIAIIELVTSVNAPSVQIAEPEVTNQYAIENSTATVAGWGGRVGYAPNEGPTSDFPDILHQVDLQLMTNQQCIDTFNENPITPIDNTFVTDNMICAAIPSGGKGSCQGDSGGPLVINTGSGIQQVGIVSWGRGCAAATNPGVYTRVSVYKEWMAAITDGVAIKQKQDFGRVPNNFISTVELQVANNANESTTVSFAIDGDNEFSLDTSNCSTLAANTSCQLTVSYSPTSNDAHEAKVLITSDNANVSVSQSLLFGKGFNAASELVGVAGPANDKVSWFSGGDLPWIANSIGGVESGAIADSQESVLIALVEGEGSLTFDWGVSSEENTADENDPFDILEFYVDNQLIEFISGEVSTATYSDTGGVLELTEGSHIISWVYNKDFDDPEDLEADDKGFVRNVVFTPVVVTTPTPTTPDTSNSSGGGSLGWLILSLFGLTFRLRTKA
ncbi:trypsin-like serine protease [Paraglaciecola arctica]|uniref:Plasma kallikrein n=1 Tax=Paraglaciecola arctica BSs20135 TaxID=493475 RepID=K6YTA0_9ALTE|nr:trypsin-like serine protease [Paraglaciecola arctica]GAC21377.1 plasma kallikrein [Paraglaciecola arctica BSs20135]